MIGKTISHYKILEKLGEGGMGVVYKAEDTKLKRIVALKFLPREYSSDIAAKERFMHEAQAASALDHPNICTIHEIGETKPALGEPGDSQSYIAMACYDGQSLKSKIDSGELTIEKSIDIVIQIAKGLKRAHEAGIVHRDIKPANIIITEHDEVKILDFGLAKLAGQTRLTKEGMTVGTVAYMSPEQARGVEVDHRSDIWSLGVILYEMLSGQLPFKGDYEQAIIYSLINEEPVQVSALNEDISPELEKIVQKCLVKNPDQRYQTIEELLIDFKPFSREAAISVDESILGILKRLWRKKIVRRISVVASIIITMSILYLLFWPKITEPTPIAVISFENQTGDTKYDILSKSIPNLLITNLEQSGRFQVVTWQRLNDLKKQLGKDTIEYIDSDLGFQLAGMEGIPNIVVGTVAKIGDIFATDLKILDVKTKEIVQTAQSRGEGDNSIFEQIDNLTRDITTQFAGFSEEKYAETHRSIMEVTTTSMQAYNYYLRGEAERDKLQYNEAVKFLEKAVELDTTFAMAYLSLAMSYSIIGNTNSRNSALEKAKISANKTSEKERLCIEYWEAYYINRDIEKMDHILRHLLKKYPKEKRFHFWLAGSLDGNQINEAIAEYKKVLALDPYYGRAFNRLAYLYLQLEEFDKAIEYAKKYASLNPGDANPLDTMGNIYFKMGELDQAVAKYKEALFVKPDFMSGFYIAYIYALQENYTQAMQSLDGWISIRNGGPKAYGYDVKGSLYAWQGNFKRAFNNILKAINIMTILGNKNSVVSQNGRLGWYHYESENYETCREFFKNTFHQLLNVDFDSERGSLNNIFYEFALGMLDLKIAIVDSAKIRLKKINSLLLYIQREDRQKIANNYYYTLSAEIFLYENNMEQAIIEYEKMQPCEGDDSFFRYNIPFIRDVIARAYIKQGDINKAITEYERLITFDPKSKDRRLIHPKYHYRLAKLYEQTDQLEKAIKEYDKFLDIWKDADKDQPELIDAKKRFAILTGKK